MKYYINYNLGVKEPSNKKADKGNVVHKALELIARKKLCQQRGTTNYIDEAFGKVEAKDINPVWATDIAFDYYSNLAEHHEWTQADRRECQLWTRKCLELNSGMFNPMRRNIIEPEQTFDFEIKKPWARYSYDLPDGTKLEGNLALKGTMDLVVEDEPGIIEVIDYKTGRRLNWATGEEKTYKKLRYDPQLLLYHYATAHLFPAAEEIFITIIYINDGGPFTICFDRSDMKITESLVRKKFEEIRDAQKPRLKQSWVCTKLCHYGKTKSDKDPNRTICDYYRRETQIHGADKILFRDGNWKAISEYGDGGGRKAETCST